MKQSFARKYIKKCRRNQIQIIKIRAKEKQESPQLMGARKMESAYISSQYLLHLSLSLSSSLFSTFTCLISLPFDIYTVSDLCANAAV